MTTSRHDVTEHLSSLLRRVYNWNALKTRRPSDTRPLRFRTRHIRFSYTSPQILTKLFQVETLSSFSIRHHSRTVFLHAGASQRMDSSELSLYFILKGTPTLRCEFLNSQYYSCYICPRATEYDDGRVNEKRSSPIGAKWNFSQRATRIDRKTCPINVTTRRTVPISRIDKLETALSPSSRFRL